MFQYKDVCISKIGIAIIKMRHNKTIRAPSQYIKTVFPGMGISKLKIRLLWDHLIFNMGIPILVRRYFYIETAPWYLYWESWYLQIMIFILIQTLGCWNDTTKSSGIQLTLKFSIIIGNGLLPVRRQAITWTNAGLLSIGSLGTNFSEPQIKMKNFSLMKMHLKMSSAKLVAIMSRGR